MKRSFKIYTIICIFIAIIASHRDAKADPWVTAYYTSWTLDNPAPANIDMRAITHLIFFALAPKSDGTLDDPGSVVASNKDAVKAAAHKAGKKVLLSIGGADSQAGFEGAMRAENRTAFIQRIIQQISQSGYDGVDIDMEPIPATDGPRYQLFIRELRAALNNARAGLLLTAAVQSSGDPAIIAPIQSCFDQINIMTYDMSGNWEGWCSWHNAPLHSGLNTFPSNGKTMPSCDTVLHSYTQAGIPITKLGIGAAFYGVKWKNTTGPMQTLGSDVSLETITYADVLSRYYSAAAYRWDDTVKVSYLALPDTSTFISYDDERACAEKMKYVLSKGLGGLMCWSIGQQYRPNQPEGKRQPLLSAIYDALHGERK